MPDSLSPEAIIPQRADVPQDAGLVAIAIIAAYHRISVQPAQLKHELGLGGRAAQMEDLVRAGNRVSLKARIRKLPDVKSLQICPLPAIVALRNGSFGILAGRTPSDEYKLIDPLTQRSVNVSDAQLEEIWTGALLLLTRRINSNTVSGFFDLRWFIPSIVKYRRAFLHVLLASLLIQVCRLVTPIFFQITVDKVLVHNGHDTLIMITAGMALIALFQVVLQFLRSYMLSHTTSRIDVELGARLFDHLLRLPLAYFETRPTGQTVARVRELENIRNFLTGQGLSSVIDVIFALIFVIVLFCYSTLLSVVFLLTVPIYILVAVILRPILRENTNSRFNRGAISQQFLVETVVGARTVKASAIEPLLRTEWEERLAAYVKVSFRGVVLASLGQNLIQLTSLLCSAVILLLGAEAVMDGQLTIGGLIAFNMLMSQATSPVLRLSQLWQDFQQMQISVDRIGDILNTRPESRSMAQAHLPPAKGAIDIEDIIFRYHPDGVEVLKGVSISIPVGQVIGIVGSSGSGKSTLTKLIQRLYMPEKGRILVDGVDISQVDPAWLRRQIGVVLQENLLFNRTVHENIALANPGMPRGLVIQAAKMAGADEFINRLALGYDTVIEERGANLSGGQRQRIAIARALATNPRVLIFDEATSALDYESERVIQNNMETICRGRTVIIIAHRLAAVSRCDRIIALGDGRILEDGTHRELILRSSSFYGRLWRMQAGVAEDAA